MTIKIEIEGQDAITATEELLAIEELKDKGSYEIINEIEKEGTLATIVDQRDEVKIIFKEKEELQTNKLIKVLISLVKVK